MSNEVRSEQSPVLFTGVLTAVFQVKRQAAQKCVASDQTDTKERKQLDTGNKRQHPGERAVDTTRSATAPLLIHDAS